MSTIQMCPRVSAAAASRVHCPAAVAQRARVAKAVREGNPIDAEPDQRRAAARVRRGGAEVVQGNTADFLNVSFLELARLRANAVARVIYRNGAAQGTGFMISDRLFLTNNHVIKTAAAAQGFLAEFDYELDGRAMPRAVTRFEFAPGSFFVTDDEDDLDYTVIAIGSRVAGAGELARFGSVRLSGTPDRHAVGEFVSIIQHPSGDYKKVALHENRIVSRLAKVLHYVTDTMPGSSGSPVFNLQCEVVALHHWGSPHRQTTYPDGRRVTQFANEGIRISAIVEELRGRLAQLPPAKATLLEAALASAEISSLEAPADRIGAGLNPGGGPITIESDGRSAVMVVPVQIRVSIGADGAAPAAAPLPVVAAAGVDDTPREEKVEIDRNYTNRNGYSPKFLDGFDIPLPKLDPAQKKLAATSNKPAPGKDKWVLDYQNFSVVVNKARRTAFYCAGNIDGKTWKHVNRDTGAISEAAEAREPWFDEPRIDASAQCNDEDYKPFAQFHRGHLLRRQYPSWGDDATLVRRADADTFHFTNCTLQHREFNPKKNRWLGLEDYILKNAKDSDVKISIFSGPVFGKKDPKFGSLRAPLVFWKVAARLDEDGLSVIALKASQAELIEAEEERLKAGGEVFDPLPVKLRVYHTSVKEIEKLTGLNFGKLRDYDVFDGNGEAAAKGRPLDNEAEVLFPRRPKRQTAAKK